MKRKNPTKRGIATFTLDGEGSFVGYHDPDVRWNGWACPHFPIESVREIATLTAQWAAEMPEEDFDVIEVDDDGRVFYTSRECGRVEAHAVEERYAIGAGGWCWSEVLTPMPKAGDRITTTAPVTRIVGEIIYTIPAGLVGLVLESDSTPDDEWIRIRQFMYVDSMGWRHEIEVYCDPDHADPWHAFTIEEVQNG